MLGVGNHSVIQRSLKMTVCRLVFWIQPAIHPGRGKTLLAERITVCAQ